MGPDGPSPWVGQGWDPYLLGGGCHALLHDNEGPGDVLLLHALAVHLDGLDPHLGLLWKQRYRDTLRGPALSSPGHPVSPALVQWLLL